MKPKKDKKSIKPDGSHAVGLQQNPYNKRQALKNLPGAQEVEKQRAEQGWVWVRKDKTRKQVHPKKLPAMLAEDWKVAS